jgi:type II secretory ATPase GspE/PulE/Tfp pilus assembly ATPase PilB-like protein
MPQTTPPRDGWLLPVLAGLLPAVELAALREIAGESIWDAAIRGGFIGVEQLVVAAAAHLRVPVADLDAADPRAAALLPERWARRFGVLPLRAGDGVLDVAGSTPHDPECERALSFATGRRVRLFMAAPDRIAERMASVYGARHVSAHGEGGSGAAGPLLGAAEAAASRGEIVRLADELLAGAIAARASDLHLEQEEGAIVVRLRVDGVLREARVLPRSVGLPLVSRIKVMSGLDISDRLRPQDGRARFDAAGASVDLRVSTLPAAYGEKVVVRILDGRAGARSLEEIGFAPDTLADIHRLLAAREGLVLVTGPTGSGKTTTLYAALRRLMTGRVNIVTVEDPVEYRLPGTVQVQVNERAGLGFAAALRSILRQDPDVILVGEIRDPETAAIAIQASLTGHLVLATLHTLDAATAVPRLADMGVEGYRLAAALRGVVAQRLVRRRCRECGGAPGSIEECASCGGSGFRGRIAIAEVLTTGERVSRVVARGAGARELADAAAAEGFRGMWEAGLGRVRAGETTEGELARVLTPPAAGNGAGERAAAPLPPAIGPA